MDSTIVLDRAVSKNKTERQLKVTDHGDWFLASSSSLIAGTRYLIISNLRRTGFIEFTGWYGSYNGSQGGRRVRQVVTFCPHSRSRER